MSVKRYELEEFQEAYPPAIMVESFDGDYVLHTDYAALEARCAGLERERDAQNAQFEAVKGRFEDALKDSLRMENDWASRMVKAESERDALQASLDSDRTSIDNICKDYRQRTNELDSLRVQHKQSLVERGELSAKLAAEQHAIRTEREERSKLFLSLKDDAEKKTARMLESQTKLAAAEEAMTHCFEYWNRSETDGAMSDALHEIIGTLEAILAGHAPATPQADHIADTSKKVQAAPSDREKRLEDLAAYVGSDHILGQLTRIFGSNQRELVELRRLLAALADTVNNGANT